MRLDILDRGHRMRTKAVLKLIGDLDTAPIEEPLRATLRMLGKLTREHSVDADDMRAVLARAFPVSRSRTPWRYVWRSTSPTGWPMRSTSAWRHRSR
jgi:hypothetical protein